MFVMPGDTTPEGKQGMLENYAISSVINSIMERVGVMTYVKQELSWSLSSSIERTASEVK